MNRLNKAGIVNLFRTEYVEFIWNNEVVRNL